MSDFYYFMSSLPMLRLEQKPYCSFSEFAERCKAYLDPEEAAVIAGLTLVPPLKVKGRNVEILASWHAFETELRNASIRYRMKARRNSGKESRDWQRPGNAAYPWAEAAVEKALGADGAYEQELAVQHIRWAFLDQLCSSHFFDFSAVIVYGLKLMILEQLGKYDSSQGQAFFEEQLKNVVANVEKNGN